jgi:hypothetical protein
MIQDVTTRVDRRPEYAERLRQFADMIEQSGTQPVGVIMQIFWEGAPTTCIKRGEDNFDILAAIGILERVKTELVLSLSTAPINATPGPPNPEACPHGRQADECLLCVSSQDDGGGQP